MSERKDIELRIPYKVGEELKREIYKQGSHEYVVFALASHAELPQKILVFIREVYLLNEGQYVETYEHGALWNGSSTINIINEAMRKKLGIIVFHAHLHSGKVSLSNDDIQSAQSLLPCYQNLIPERPHGFVVLSYDNVDGLILLPDYNKMQTISRMRWISNVINDWDSIKKSKTIKISKKYDRQTLLIGGRGQERLRSSKAAVVGLCGGGSHVVQQLAYLGIGEIIGIDDDIVEEENLNRMIGASLQDVKKRRLKTEVMKNMVKKINKDLKFTEVKSKIPQQLAVNNLKNADIVVGCVDSFLARSEIQELCLQYMIPYIDMGLLITPSDNSSDNYNIGGNVNTVIPGSICMRCYGFLSEERLNNETNGKPKSYFQGSDKQAQVVSFNGILASAAVNEVLTLITGYSNPTDHYNIKKFDGLNNSLENWEVSPDPNCNSCLNQVGKGDPVWVNVN